MVEHLMVLAPAAAVGPVNERLAALDGRLVQAYGDTAWVVDVASERIGELTQHPDVTGVYDGPAPVELAGTDEAARLGIAAWNMRHSTPFRESRQTRVGEGRSWGDEEFEREG